MRGISERTKVQTIREIGSGDFDSEVLHSSMLVSIGKKTIIVVMAKSRHEVDEVGKDKATAEGSYTQYSISYWPYIYIYIYYIYIYI